MKHYIFITAVLIASFITVKAEDINEQQLIYEQALTEYQDNNYEKSLELFQKLIDNGYSSFKLYYNAGNAAFKSDNIPLAILNYEKALLFRPFNEDARYNLEIARTYTVDKLEVIPEIFFVRWFRMLSLLMHTNTWSAASLSLFALSLILLGVFLFSSGYRIKRAAFILSVTAFLLSALSLSLALTNKSLTANNNHAIVFEPVVTGSSSPGTGGNELFIIHEGTKVEIERKLGEWYEIRLSDGTVGWVNMSFVKKITP